MRRAQSAIALTSLPSRLIQRLTWALFIVAVLIIALLYSLQWLTLLLAVGLWVLLAAYAGYLTWQAQQTIQYPFTVWLCPDGGRSTHDNPHDNTTTTRWQITDVRFSQALDATLKAHSFISPLMLILHLRTTHPVTFKPLRYTLVCAPDYPDADAVRRVRVWHITHKK